MLCADTGSADGKENTSEYYEKVAGELEKLDQAGESRRINRDKLLGVGISVWDH